MASNGIVFRPGRGPSFILVGLVVIVIILFYSYWGVSSKNSKLLRDVSVLQDRLRVLAARKLTADKKGSALMSQITQMQDEKAMVIKDKASKESTISKLTENLQNKEGEVKKFKEQEKNYQAELETLKRGVNSSSSDLRTLKDRADQLLQKYKEMKQSNSLLLQQITNLTSERDLCQKELAKVNMGLEKKTQDIKVEPSNKDGSDKTNDAKKVKVTDEGQSVDKDSQESEKNDENKDDQNTDSSKEGKEADEGNKPVPSGRSVKQNNDSKAVNVSASPKVPEDIKPDGSESQSEVKQANSDNSEEMKRSNVKDEENAEQSTEGGATEDKENQDESKEKKDAASDNDKSKEKDSNSDNEESQQEKQDVESQVKKRNAASENEENQQENKDEVNEEDENEDDEADEDLDQHREKVKKGMDLANEMKRHMVPFQGDGPQKMSRNSQHTSTVEDIRNLQKNTMDSRGVMPGRFDPLGISDKLEEARRRKEAEEAEDQGANERSFRRQ